MKTILGTLGALASIVLFGWLIFGVGGTPGAYALGFLLGVIFSVVLGTYLTKETS